MNKVDKSLEIIKNALEMVEQPYYRLETTYDTSGIVRERVFCYELYHKMRLLMENNKELGLSLNGEIDKRGHTFFDREDRRNPDFVFHVPGEMERNTIVIEVKGKAERDYVEDCLKDFDTLATFVDKYQYKLGVYILYNYCECPKQLHNELQKVYKFYDKEILNRIVILCKEREGEKLRTTTLYKIVTKSEEMYETC